MKVIDTTGTNIRIRRTPGKSEWFYSTDGVNFTKATFKQCLQIVTDARTTNPIPFKSWQQKHAEFLKTLTK